MYLIRIHTVCKASRKMLYCFTQSMQYSMLTELVQLSYLEYFGELIILFSANTQVNQHQFSLYYNILQVMNFPYMLTNHKITFLLHQLASLVHFVHCEIFDIKVGVSPKDAISEEKVTALVSLVQCYIVHEIFYLHKLFFKKLKCCNCESCYGISHIPY